MHRLGLTLITVTLLLAACGKPVPSAPVGVVLEGETVEAAAKGLHAYRGIQHTHVEENGDDGQGTLNEAYAFARDRAHLDYMGVSSHAHMIDDHGYAVMRDAVKRQTRPGKFVALLAQEWSSISSGGHVNIIGSNTRCDVANGDWDTFYKRWLPAHPEVTFVQFNHPHPDNPLEFGGVGFSPLASSQAATVARDKVAGMAIINGPGKYTKPDMHGEPDAWDLGANGLNYESEYFEILNRGWRIAPVGDADNHVKNWGLAIQTRTGVWAKDLTPAELAAGFQARRIFAAKDCNVSLWLTVDGHPMGSVNPLPTAKTHAVTVTVTDPDTTIKRIELFGDTDGVGGQPAHLVATAKVNKRSATWDVPVPVAGGDAWYLAKVVYDDQHAWAWSSPVWFSR